MHAILESLGQRYVKRRGLEHISWRVCDAGLAAAPDLTKKYTTLCRYLHYDMTWARFQALATLNFQLGGVGLVLAILCGVCQVLQRLTSWNSSKPTRNRQKLSSLVVSSRSNVAQMRRTGCDIEKHC